jgi:hypothetical protein
VTKHRPRSYLKSLSKLMDENGVPESFSTGEFRDHLDAKLTMRPLRVEATIRPNRKRGKR